MNGELTAFCQSLGLSSEDAQAIKGKLHESSSYQNALDVASTTVKLALGEDRVIPPTNKKVVNGNWSLSCVAEPYCIIQPENAQDVSKVIEIVKYFKIKFAIRSGGHSPNPGASSIESTGVLIDLQRMNQIVLSSDKTVASLGPGGRWGEVVKTLDSQGATVIGGRGPDIGVAGVILGGGLFHLTEFGLAADNAKNFEVVLADGTITNANSEQNSDLFWALKGGGPNFGVVTRFDLYTVPVREVWYNVLAYSPDQAPELLDAFVQYQKQGGSSDAKSTASLVMGIDNVLLLLVYGASQPQPSTFEPFYDVEPSQVIVPAITGTFSALTDLFALVANAEPMRHDYRGISTRIDAQLYKDVYKFWREKALAVREATGANQIFTLQPISANVAAQGIAKGGNPMSIPQEDHQWWTTLIDWKDEKDDDLVRSVSIETTEQWKKLGQARGSYLEFVYTNDASRDQSPLATYGPENIQKLRNVARKYDETQLFQTQQNSGFLLSKI